MRTFIANFGRENYLWPACLDRSTLVMFEDEDMYPFVIADDRAGYIDRCIATKKTAAGNTPTRPVASRWFNLHHILSTTENDLWIHREKNELWWTISHPGEVDACLESAFGSSVTKQQVYIFRKQADPWSNKTKKGNRLEWPGLHAKAREFLFTESTFQRLSEDNASYALALIDGRDLTSWHSRPEWQQKAEAAGRNPATIFNAKQRAIARMAMTARETVKHANGQQVLRTTKTKELRFAGTQEFETYISTLIDDQEGLCAVTGLRLQFDHEHEDAELLCSLDRIDSDCHYEPGNLQVVCRFVNRWKSDSNDDEFRRLIDLVRREGDSVRIPR